VQEVPATTGQDMLGHAPLLALQVTSHLHEPAQSIDGHASWPVQLISHAAGPQLMLPHAAWPEQSILQCVPSAQSMSPQLAVPHRMVQSKPGGHFTGPQAVPALHWTSQVLSVRSQDVHGLGHALVVSTQ
jgi:hypothetical protein